MMNGTNWRAYPANIVTVLATANAPATTTTANRPTAPTHRPIVNSMTGPTIAIHRYGNERHETWHKAREQLMMAIIRSLGATLAGTIGPPPNGFKMMSIIDIMDSVAMKFATVDWTSLKKMDDIMATPLDNIMLLDSHLARLTRHIMSVVAGFDVEEHRRVKMFCQSVQHHPQIAKTLESYDQAHPNPKNHTFTLITAHVRTQLPPSYRQRRQSPKSNQRDGEQSTHDPCRTCGCLHRTISTKPTTDSWNQATFGCGQTSPRQTKLTSARR